MVPNTTLVVSILKSFYEISEHLAREQHVAANSFIPVNPAIEKLKLSFSE